MTLYSLICADMPLRNYSLTHLPEVALAPRCRLALCQCTSSFVWWKSCL